MTHQPSLQKVPAAAAECGDILHTLTDGVACHKWSRAGASMFDRESDVGLN